MSTEVTRREAHHANPSLDHIPSVCYNMIGREEGRRTSIVTYSVEQGVGEKIYKTTVPSCKDRRSASQLPVSMLLHVLILTFCRLRCQGPCGMVSIPL